MKTKSILLLCTALLLFVFSCNVEGNKKNTETKAASVMNDKQNEKGRVTGIGGIFFKTTNPEESREWYRENLGLVTNEYGSLFESRNTDNPEQKTYLQWSPFSETTKYFLPSEKEFMINYRVINIEALVEDLKAKGVTVLDTIESFEYGKFVHIMDNDGNKIELWEPVDDEFTRTNEGKTTH